MPPVVVVGVVDVRVVLRVDVGVVEVDDIIEFVAVEPRVSVLLVPVSVSPLVDSEVDVGELDVGSSDAEVVDENTVVVVVCVVVVVVIDGTLDVVDVEDMSVNAAVSVVRV